MGLLKKQVNDAIACKSFYAILHHQLRMSLQEKYLNEWNSLLKIG